jgi:ribonuclease BN (tRNA processing enzyme)
MLCASGFAAGPRSTSGFDLAADVNLLVHDAQYTADEYKSRIGWGHSAIPHAFAFAAAVGAHQFMPFHHDPTHDDAALDMIYGTSQSTRMHFDGDIVPATEGLTINLMT